jgi:hypothetical protein
MSDVMEKLITDLKEVIEFKDTTEPGDIVLIVAKEPQMLIYAYVSSIERDANRKDEWWNIDLMVLAIPPQRMTWTLRTPQMTGMEVFTMGGEERFVKALNFTHKVPEEKPNEEKKTTGFIKRVK